MKLKHLKIDWCKLGIHKYQIIGYVRTPDGEKSVKECLRCRQLNYSDII